MKGKNVQLDKNFKERRQTTLVRVSKDIHSVVKKSSEDSKMTMSKFVDELIMGNESVAHEVDKIRKDRKKHLKKVRKNMKNTAENWQEEFNKNNN